MKKVLHKFNDFASNESNLLKWAEGGPSFSPLPDFGRL